MEQQAGAQAQAGRGGGGCERPAQHSVSACGLALGRSHNVWAVVLGQVEVRPQVAEA